MKYVTFEMPDEFEKGDCLKCPISFSTGGLNIACALRGEETSWEETDKCPLEISEKNLQTF